WLKAVFYQWTIKIPLQKAEWKIPLNVRGFHLDIKNVCINILFISSLYLSVNNILYKIHYFFSVIIIYIILFTNIFIRQFTDSKCIYYFINHFRCIIYGCLFT